MMTLTLEGMDEVKKALKDASENMRREVEKCVARSMYRIHARAIKRIQGGPASGRLYTLYSPKRDHQASSPGEAPASDTGRLVSSAQVDHRWLDAFVTFNAIYARPLEFGRGNPKMDPRPFLFPSLEEDAPVFEEELKGILK